jgi:hypothetical protein
MTTPQRRRRDRLNQVVGTPATVPTATGDMSNPVVNLASEPSHDDIARRAYALYEERGGGHGHDWEDWFKAERELRQLALHTSIDSILTRGRTYASA